MGNGIAIINSSIRYCCSSKYSEAIIDQTKAEALLENLAYYPAIYAAWWYQESDIVYVFRLDENNRTLNKYAIRTQKYTPVSLENKSKQIKQVLLCPFIRCWQFTYTQRILNLVSSPQH